MPIRLCSVCQGKDETLEVIHIGAKAEYGVCTKCGNSTMVREMRKIYPDMEVPKTKDGKTRVAITADDLFKIINSIKNMPVNTDKIFTVAGTGFTDKQCIDFFDHSSVLVITRKGEFYKGGIKVDAGNL